MKLYTAANTAESPPVIRQWATPPAANDRAEGLAVLALLLGIFAVATSWTIFGGLALGIFACLLNFALRPANPTGRTRRIARAGLVLGLVGIAMSLAVLTLVAIWFARNATDLHLNFR